MNLSPVLPELDLLSARLVYFVGIKGVGMTALAVLLKDAGVDVQGADVEESFITDPLLSKRGIVVEEFSAAQLPEETTAVVYSGAHQGNKQPLVVQAQERGLPCLNLAEAVGLVSQQKETIGICGVGGKSTTSAFLSWILESAGWLPSYAVGVGTIPNLGTSARWQAGHHFVVEADEYVSDPQLPTEALSPRFLSLSPKHAICTSLSYDHPDVYASFEDTEAAYRAFFRKLPTGGKLVVNGDQAALVALAQEFSHTLQVISVGENEENEVQITNLRIENGQGLATLVSASEEIDIAVSVPGFHNLRNAAYAAVMARSLGVGTEAIQAAVQSFRSTTRRFELVGVTPEGMYCFDDYAHHPRELMAIAEALSQWFPGQEIRAAFQPHTFSRTKALFADFVEALQHMPGEVVLLPIFSSAREQDDPTVSSDLLAQELQKQGKPVRSLQSQAELLEYLQDWNGSGKVFMTLGAGDIYKVYEQLSFQSAE